MSTLIPLEIFALFIYARVSFQLLTQVKQENMSGKIIADYPWGLDQHAAPRFHRFSSRWNGRFDFYPTLLIVFLSHDSPEIQHRQILFCVLHKHCIIASNIPYYFSDTARCVKWDFPRATIILQSFSLSLLLEKKERAGIRHVITLMDLTLQYHHLFLSGTYTWAEKYWYICTRTIKVPKI